MGKGFLKMTVFRETFVVYIPASYSVLDYFMS